MGIIGNLIGNWVPGTPIKLVIGEINYAHDCQKVLTFASCIAGIRSIPLDRFKIWDDSIVVQGGV